ncbi:MAG: LD-carboxypeptidase, partial [Bacteroidota bacterium]
PVCCLIFDMASPLSRRRFLGSAALAGAALSVPTAAATPLAPVARPLDAVKPKRLREGDTIALISPAGIVRESQVERAQNRLGALGLNAVVGEHALARYGYLAGTDTQRAADVNAAFADPQVDGILALRGGWGCARMLPYVDWSIIRDNPKALIGYSDLTSLLLAIYARTGLIGFHGPTGISNFSPFTVASLRAAAFQTKPTPLAPNTALIGEETMQPETIRPGTARGRLVGGNLSVLAALAGTPWLPSFEGHILFLEDIGEDVYRVDRMMTQIAQAGLLDGLTGFVFGSCRGCGNDVDSVGTFTFEEIVRQHIEPLGIPAILGAPIGHITDKLTMPIGAMAELNASTGEISLTEAAVKERE